MKTLTIKAYSGNATIFCDYGNDTGHYDIDYTADNLEWADTKQEALDAFRDDILEAFGDDVDKESLESVLDTIAIYIDCYF